MAARLELFADRLGLAPQLRPRVALAAALIVWLILHVVAIETAAPDDSAEAASLATSLQGQFVHLVTATLQYLMPLGFCVGAGLVLLKRWRTRRKATAVATKPGIPVGSMAWRDFEQLIVAAFRGHGFAIGAFGAAAADGSLNFVLAKGSARWLVHCKHWRAWQVSRSAVEELHEEISRRHATGGYLVSGGWFSQEARQLAADLGITLLDGDSLGKYLAEVGVERTWRSAGSAAARATPPTLTEAVERHATHPSSPTCPKCGSPMERRAATRGKLAGHHFWGCQQHPHCFGILPIMDESLRQSA
jgi:restriction system protein